ncbi:Cu(I)/Ag(I) efflux system membrane fusion protein [Catalinimonas alkaloidigena]|uniref:efflux RND transporter periplasmic adaptor subunit n=1 Tax=Catalinimonas alkaloidigena TaxID=1075417 RepID=UPI002404A44D|nr:efflux RND transporter periplasmic adaptor subunit [Catalinimonas alkaloidigena]MDF9799177.1 Cu(I)/Ag(I) efflux system membrane fusion protein [Catalinimonas alkaloidigena]
MNANKKIIIIALSTLAIGLMLGWLIFGGSSSESKMDDEHQHTTEIAGETVWTCSMHPQIRQGEPGDCPICGMNLIPLEDDQNEVLDPMAVSMSPTAMQLADIRTAAVGTMDPVKSVRLNGKVQEDERLVFSQSSHIPGRIEKLMVNFTGEFVRKGQAIAYIYSPDLVTAQEELFEAQKIKETQPQLFKSARVKLKNWKLSDSQIDKILERGTPSDEFPITADISGYVLSKNVNVGDYIKRGEPIYEIANLSRVWVMFDVYESDMPWINKGDQVQFTVQSLPGQTFESKISFLDPVIDPKTRVAKARVEMPNKDNQLKPEMFASGTVEAILPKKSNNIVVPKTAVMWTGKRSVVYVKNTTASGVSFMMRDVTLGPGLGDSFIVESGLEEGEEIAVNGTFSIDAAAQLAGKPSMMNPEGGPAMTGHNHGGMDMPASSDQVMKKETKPVSISQKAKEALRPLYTEYLKFKDALTTDEFDQAQKAASDLKTTLDKVNMSAFTGESHNAWMSYSSDLKNALQHVQHLKTIAELRTTFQQVSEGMIAMTKTFNPLDQTLYVQFCPMADDNKGANWLSTEEEIRNPYFGESMLTCGEVQENIK